MDAIHPGIAPRPITQRPLLVAFLFAACCLSASAQPQGASTCGTVISPEGARNYLENAAYPAPWDRGDLAPTKSGGITTYYIPLVFHAVRADNGTGGVTNQQIIDCLNLLDAAFATPVIPSGYWQMKFYLSKPLDVIPSTAYLVIDNPAELESLKSIANDPSALDVYFVDDFVASGFSLGSPLTGFSTYSVVSGLNPGLVQGVVVRNQSLPPVNNSTLPHEVGHYFDLFHTEETMFGADWVTNQYPNTYNYGDLVPDTPAAPDLYTGNVNYLTCSFMGTQKDMYGVPYSLYPPDAQDYMNTTPDQSIEHCRIHFTMYQNIRACQGLFNARPEMPKYTSPQASFDCNGNGIRDDAEIALGLTADLNENLVPDSCETCQSSVGYGGPGNMNMSVCGAADLSLPGGQATLQIVHAPPSSPLFFFSGLQNNPTPSHGGVLVPVPWNVQVTLFPDVSGKLSFPITGGYAFPLTLYVQAVGSDASGYLFSNAVAMVLGV